MLLDRKIENRLKKDDEKYYFCYTFEELTDAQTLFYKIAHNIETMLNDITGKDYMLSDIAKEAFDKKHSLTPYSKKNVEICGINFLVKRVGNNLFRLQIKRRINNDN